VDTAYFGSENTAGPSARKVASRQSLLGRIRPHCETQSPLCDYPAIGRSHLGRFGRLDVAEILSLDSDFDIYRRFPAVNHSGRRFRRLSSLLEAIRLGRCRKAFSS